MAALPSDDLVWSIVKKHNSFVRKGLNGAVFSAEPYNLYNLHCKRFSGSLLKEEGATAFWRPFILSTNRQRLL